MAIFSNTKWLSGSLALAGGSIVAQFGSLALLPILSRHFSPEEFGYYATILAASTLLGGIVTLRLDTIIQVLGQRFEGLRILSVLVVVQLACSFFGTTCLALGLLLANRFLMGAGFLLLMSASQSAFLTMRAYSFQGSNFSRAAWAPVFRSFLFPLGALLMWYMTPEPHYGSALFLLIAALLSDIFVIFHLAGGLGQSERRALSLQLVKRGWQDIVEHKSWMASNSFFQIVNLLALQAPINMIGLIYGGQEAGWFALSQRIAFAPALFLGFSITSVVQRKAAERFHASQSIITEIGFITILNFGVLILGYAGLFVISLVGSDKLLGREWQGAETTFQILLIWALIYGLSNSLNFVLTLKKMQRSQIGLAIARTCALFLTFSVAALTHASYLTCLIVLTTMEVIYYLCSLLAAIIALRVYENKLRLAGAGHAE